MCRNGACLSLLGVCRGGVRRPASHTYIYFFFDFFSWKLSSLDPHRCLFEVEIKKIYLSLRLELRESLCGRLDKPFDGSQYALLSRGWDFKVEFNEFHRGRFGFDELAIEILYIHSLI
jgi:hypothetical protein